MLGCRAYTCPGYCGHDPCWAGGSPITQNARAPAVPSRHAVTASTGLETVSQTPHKTASQVQCGADTCNSDAGVEGSMTLLLLQLGARHVYKLLDLAAAKFAPTLLKA